MFRTRVFITALLTASLAAAQAAAPNQLQLADAVREALAHNPAISAATHTKTAETYSARLAKALPDPTVTVGWMGDPTPFQTMSGDPSSYRSVSAMEALPWPGKRRAAAAVAEKDVAIAAEDQKRATRRVVAAVKAAFYDYFFFAKALEITQANKTHLQQFADISNARYRVGKATQQDVLRAQVELSLLLQRTVTLEQQRDAAAARLNTLMGREAEAPLAPAAEPPRPVLPALADLMPLVVESPDVLRESRTIERAKAVEQLARKEYRPDIGVGYMYQQRASMPDMHGMTFSVSIPLFYGKKRDEAVAQAREQQLAAEAGRTDVLHETQNQLQQAYLAAEAAQRMVNLYDKAVLPQTALALESSESAYQVGSVDFLTMLNNFTTLNSYQIDYYRQLADYGIAVATIEAIAGEQSTRAAGRTPAIHGIEGRAIRAVEPADDGDRQ